MNPKAEKYYNYVIEDLISKTHWKDASFTDIMLDDKIYLTVHLNHSGKIPKFNWIPESFEDYISTMYGVRKSELAHIWERYSPYVVDMYLKKKGK